MVHAPSNRACGTVHATSHRVSELCTGHSRLGRGHTTTSTVLRLTIFCANAGANLMFGRCILSTERGRMKDPATCPRTPNCAATCVQIRPIMERSMTVGISRCRTAAVRRLMWLKRRGQLGYWDAVIVRFLASASSLHRGLPGWILRALNLWYHTQHR